MFTHATLEAGAAGRHVNGMAWNDTRRQRGGPVLDMTPDGRFVDENLRSASPVAARVLGVSVLVAVLAGMLGFAFLALWLALQLIPIAIAAGLVAYGTFRFQRWRQRAASLRRHGNPLRR